MLAKHFSSTTKAVSAQYLARRHFSLFISKRFENIEMGNKRSEKHSCGSLKMEEMLFSLGGNSPKTISFCLKCEKLALKLEEKMGSEKRNKNDCNAIFHVIAAHFQIKSSHEFLSISIELRL